MRKTKSAILGAVEETMHGLAAAGVTPRWSPELRRAMMKVRPEYFGWSVAEQKRYGVSLPKEDRQRLAQELLDALFGRKFRSPQAAAQAANRLPLEKLNRWNETILPLVGIGEDSFYLNTWFGENRCILDFDTLRSYDEDDHRFQEEARAQEDSAYQRRPYRGALYMTWARLFVDTQFTYGVLSMAAGYLYSRLSDAASDLIQVRIPHRLVPGKHHGQADGEHWRWDMRLEADDGQEALLEELQRRVFEYEAARYEALLSEWDAAGRRGVFLVDTSEPPERNLHAVFSNKDALAAVRFRSFLRDCRALERPVAELHQALAEEKTKVAAFIDEQHEDLLNHFDPKVVPLQKRRRIMIHNHALDDLAPNGDG